MELSKPGFRRKLQGLQLPDFFRYIHSQGKRVEDLVFLCVGTDRSTGDALGPLVGTYLAEAGYPRVVGTLEHPCDASNILERIRELPDGKTVIAIDACLGLPISVGQYQVADMPLEPGKSVGRRLPPVGDYSVAAIVNVDGPKKYWILQNTSLHRVVQMAKEITTAIAAVFPVESD